MHKRVQSTPATVIFERAAGDFPNGAVDKNLPASAGDMHLIPGPGRFHMVQSS